MGRRTLHTIDGDIVFVKVIRDRYHEHIHGFPFDTQVETDALIAWMDSANSQPTVSDRYITAKSVAGVSPTGDAQDARVNQGSYADGMMTVSFTRPVDTSVGFSKLI